jgi:hypothetical protein
VQFVVVMQMGRLWRSHGAHPLVIATLRQRAQMPIARHGDRLGRRARDRSNHILQTVFLQPIEDLVPCSFLLHEQQCSAMIELSRESASKSPFSRKFLEKTMKKSISFRRLRRRATVSFGLRRNAATARRV